MTALSSVDLTVLHFAGCQATEVAPQPFHAVQEPTWRLDCETEGCEFTADGLDHHDAIQIAHQHKYREHPKTSTGCATCGGPCLPGRTWCSVSCHKADEPGAYDEDPYPQIGEVE